MEKVDVNSNTRHQVDGEVYNHYDIYDIEEIYPFKKCQYENFKMRKKFSFERYLVDSIDISPFGNYMVTSINNNSIVTFNIPIGCEMDNISSFKYGCDNIIFAGEESKVLYTSTKHNDDIRYLSLEDKKYVRFFNGHKSKVLSLSMSPDGRNFLSSSKDGSIKLWDFRSNECCDSSRYININPKVKYDPKGLIYAVSEENNVVKLFDSRYVNLRPFKFLQIHSSSWYVNNIKFSPDGIKILASGNGTHFCTFDTFTGEKVYFDGIENCNKRNFGVDFSPCGRRIIAGSDSGKLICYDSSTGKKVKTITSSHDCHVRNVVFHRRYFMLITGGYDLIWWTPDYDYDEMFSGLD